MLLCQAPPSIRKGIVPGRTVASAEVGCAFPMRPLAIAIVATRWPNTLAPSTHSVRNPTVDGFGPTILQPLFPGRGRHRIRGDCSSSSTSSPKRVSVHRGIAIAFCQSARLCTKVTARCFRRGDGVARLHNRPRPAGGARSQPVRWCAVEQRALATQNRT